MAIWVWVKRGPQMSVHVFIYQGSILGTYFFTHSPGFHFGYLFFDPQPRVPFWVPIFTHGTFLSGRWAPPVPVDLVLVYSQSFAENAAALRLGGF